MINIFHVSHTKVYIGLVVSLLLASCSGQYADKEKIEAAINKSLLEDAKCGKAVKSTSYKFESEIRRDAVVSTELLRQGLIAPGTVQYMSTGNGVMSEDGFLATEKGKEFLKPQKNQYATACFIYGYWKIKSIEAIDYGTDSTGKSVASARAAVEFIPTEWFKATKSNPDWKSQWDEYTASSKYRILFKVFKSGNEFFYSGDFERLDIK